VSRHELLLFSAALIDATCYVAFAGARGVSGFALDDAWIHQVYARNLALRGEFAFTPGLISVGSTSPLWSILLSAGYLFHVDFRLWSYFLGALFLGASTLVAARLARRLLPLFPLHNPMISIPVGLGLVLEWHLAWSAVSGMEIPLFIFLSLALLEGFLAVPSRPAWGLGLTAGLLALTRPEGIVLAGLVGLGLLWRELERWRWEREALGLGLIISPMLYSIGLAIIVVPDLVFNMVVSGTPLPNTFYAKNTEYAILMQTPLVLRWLQLSLLPWVGAQILLLPGFLFIAGVLAYRRRWYALMPLAWVFILPLLYAFRLPVVYQYGRYEMPVIPFIVVYGVWGTAALFERIGHRVARRTWGWSVAALFVVFWFLGATRYATDVGTIDCEMVQTAQWVAGNTPAGAVVAAHDIGALGYYYEHPVIDLAGLVSPEVIPFLRDEGALRDYLFARQTRFAIFFPDWYPSLSSDARFVRVHQQNCPLAREATGTDMAVYEIVR
jgi:hypothetical protein